MSGLTLRIDQAGALPQLAVAGPLMRYLTLAACALLASGMVLNENSYFLVVLIALLCLRPTLDRFSPLRGWALVSTMVLVIFGSAQGYLRGHEIAHISRFALPLSSFAVFCAFPGLGLLLFRARDFMLYVCFALTLLFTYIVKTGNFEWADGLMSGWTMTYSSLAAISVWHYFALPFCACGIYEALSEKWTLHQAVRLGLSLATLTMLVLLNDTSSFLLAMALTALLFILPKRLGRIFALPVLFFLILFLADFFTVKVISNWLVNQMQILGAEDVGDLLRVIQMEYFVARAEFLGSGFGARHDFPFMVSASRQLSQVLYPYASELPIVNILFNGGALAASWFVTIILLILRLVTGSGASTREHEHMRRFGIGCTGILVGSMSNPFLFAPASMMLLAIMLDLIDVMPRTALIDESGRTIDPALA